MPSAEPLAIRLTSAAAWRRGDGPWCALADKDALLLARLALEGAQPRALLASWLWPLVAPPRANANLRQRLFRLRGPLDAALLEQGDGLALSDLVLCDLVASHGDDGAAHSTLLPGIVAASLSAGLAQWLDDARGQWALRHPERLAARAARQESAGALAAAIDTSEQMLALDAVNEHGWRRLMRLHYLRGDRAAAVQAFERCEAVLRSELGIAPSGETVALLASIEHMRLSTPKAAREPLPPGLLRPPRLVGRAAAMDTMLTTWAEQRCFLLVGDAGLGKSRLLTELATARQGVWVVAARPGDEAVPYALVLRLLRALLSSLPHWPLPSAPHRLELARLLPELGPAPTAPGHEALLHGAVMTLLASAPLQDCSAVLVDDLHHADEASLILLKRLAASPGLAWGFASRPQGIAAWQDWLASSARLQMLQLQGLDEQGLHELLASLNLPSLDVAAVAPAMLRHCGGNPLFVLETLKHLWLETRTGPRAGEALPLPATMALALAQRLSALSPQAQAVARVAAVAGADFQAEVAADVMACDLLALAAPLQELETAQLLQGHHFVHESVLDAALRSVPQALRSPLHARVAASLQQRLAPAARVAQHHAAAGDWAAAGQAARAAAAQAFTLGRTSERLTQLRAAARWFEAAGLADAAFDAHVAAIDACMGGDGLSSALAMCQQLLTQAQTPERQLPLRLAQASVALAGYDGALALDAAQAALRVASPGSDDELRARVMHAAALALLGQTQEAVLAVQALQPRLEQLGDAPDAAELWSQWALVQYRAGQVLPCVEALGRQRQLAQRSGQLETEAAALSSLSGQHIVLGDSELAVQEAREAGRLYRRMGADSSATMCDVNLAIALLGVDQMDEALALLDQALSAVQRTAPDSDLLLAVEDLRATWWLRVGDAGQARTALMRVPLAALSGGRLLSRCTLLAVASDLEGQQAAATALWQQARALDAKGIDAMQRLRSMALASVVLDDAAALAELAAIDEEAGDRHFHAGRALVRMQRIPRHLRCARLDEATADAQALLALRPRARHRFVAEAELLARVCSVYDKTGDALSAAALRNEAQRWARAQVLPHLAPELHKVWQAHNAHARLWQQQPNP